MLRNDDAAFFNYSSYLLYLFLQVRKKATALSGVCKFQGYHCQNSTIHSFMTNGIRQVRLEVDIFDKRILDSLGHSASEYGAQSI